jgi:hypothetical protein
MMLGVLQIMERLGNSTDVTGYEKKNERHPR